eukprot:scaffold256740_cov34-Tisochrysis_lutea.AAC.1
MLCFQHPVNHSLYRAPLRELQGKNAVSPPPPDVVAHDDKIDVSFAVPGTWDVRWIEGQPATDRTDAYLSCSLEAVKRTVVDEQGDEVVSVLPVDSAMPGEKLTIKNLRSRPDLNGLTGEVVGGLEDGRIPIQVEGQSPVRIKPSNLARPSRHSSHIQEDEKWNELQPLMRLERNVWLPPSADVTAAGVHATHKDGTLHISIPRIQQSTLLDIPAVAAC